MLCKVLFILKLLLLCSVEWIINFVELFKLVELNKKVLNHAPFILGEHYYYMYFSLSLVIPFYSCACTCTNFLDPIVISLDISWFNSTVGTSDDLTHYTYHISAHATPTTLHFDWSTFSKLVEFAAVIRGTHKEWVQFVSYYRNIKMYLWGGNISKWLPDS